MNGKRDSGAVGLVSPENESDALHTGSGPRTDVVLKGLENLPTLPGIAVKILEAVQKKDASAKELGAIISKDPALSIKILKTVNSPFYGLAQKVTSVPLAVNYLGLSAVKSLALSFSLIDASRKAKSNHFDHTLFWKSSLLSALSAKLMADKLKPQKFDDAFFLGLLHNIGILALNQSIPDQYSDVVKEQSERLCEYHLAEDRILGFNHMEIGSKLLEKWGLPKTFVIPISYHHKPEELPEKDPTIELLTRILHVTATLVELVTMPQKRSLLIEFDSLTRKYGFAESVQLKLLATQIHELSKKIFPIFEIEPERKTTYVDIIEKARRELAALSADSIKTLEEQKRLIGTLRRQSSEDKPIIGAEEMILEVNPDGTVGYVNAQMAKVLSVKESKDVLGSPIERWDAGPFGHGVFAALVEVARSSSGPHVLERECVLLPSGLLPSLTSKRPAGPPILRFTATPVKGSVHIVVQEITLLRWLETTFSRYLSPAIIDQIQRLNVDEFFKMERKELTVLFCDLRGFTKMSQHLSPNEIQHSVNSFLQNMVKATEDNGGIVDKFMGDEVMAIFGAPLQLNDHALRAIITAVDMQHAHSKWNEMRRKSGRPTAGLGIGIATGEMAVGNVGTPSRMDYTVLGHWVNVASRLCDAAKGGEILTVQQTQENSADAMGRYSGEKPLPDLRFSPKGKMRFKNVDEPMEIISVVYSD